MSTRPVILWFRRDLRLADHAALAAACRLRRPVVPLYIWAPEEKRPWTPGAASRWWLHHSLAALSESLEKKGSRLILRVGPAETVLRDLIRTTRADTVYWSRMYEPTMIARDSRLKSALHGDGVVVESFNSALLFEPWTIQNKSGKPFQVFTPFWNHCQTLEYSGDVLSVPRNIPAPTAWPRSESIESLDLLPKIRWDDGLGEAWTPGAMGARRALASFTDHVLANYGFGRDRPDRVGTSRLSPHLHFGEIGPRQIWHAVNEAATRDTRTGMVRGAESFLRELGWREFAYHLLFHFPHTTDRPLREEFNDFPWRRDPAGLKAWQEGMTGYPIVDAGMRELWRTGWMHNRVRMIVASFLVKDLLIPWQAGARWFWDTLVDADLANNTLGWQWTAGCGADAAPYFRIFNPVLQGEKFDPGGAYVRKWIPELKAVPDKLVHKPWLADQPPADYPAPIVDHGEARARALAALAEAGG